MRALALVSLPALAAAKMHPCAADPDEGQTGLGLCLGPVLNTLCPLELRPECDNMFDISLFTDSGIPCGSATGGSCAPMPNISFPNEAFPLAALEAVQTRVEERLVRGRDNSEEDNFFDFSGQKLRIARETQVNITFLYEGACDRNTLGLTSFPAALVPNGEPRDITFATRKQLLEDVLDFSVIFPNTDFEFCQCAHEDTPDSYADFCTESRPELRIGTTMRLLPDFRADPGNLVFEPDTFLSLFLLPDGFDSGYRPGSAYVRAVEQVLFSTPELNDPDMVLKTPGREDLRQHAFIFSGFEDVEADGETFDFGDETFVCFEDRRRFEAPEGLVPSNNDFEDLCVFLSFLEDTEPSAAPSLAPSFATCEEGILSSCGNVCCAAECGRCGGCDCGSLPGGADKCCPSAILFNGLPCLGSTDVACVVDAEAICAVPGTGCDFE